MVKTIILSCLIVFVYIPYYSCWILNDINTNILAKTVNISDELLDEVRAAALTKQVSFIFPGTKWCGAGNNAENYDDLGPEKEADMCCRDHDHCPDIIQGRESKYNLTNDAFYTRLSCECDGTFHSCLKSANTTTARIIGAIYFNALQTKCFRLDYPATCTKKGGWINTKCVEYTYDTNATKVYQWFDEEDF